MDARAQRAVSEDVDGRRQRRGDGAGAWRDSYARLRAPFRAWSAAASSLNVAAVRGSPSQAAISGGPQQTETGRPMDWQRWTGIPAETRSAVAGGSGGSRGAEAVGGRGNLMSRRERAERARGRREATLAARRFARMG